MNTIKRSYTVDFQNMDNDFEVLHQGLIKTKKIKKFGIERLPNYKLRKFAISDLVIDNNIITNQNEDIIYIKCKGNNSTSFYSLQVQEYDLPYEIIFNRSAILDYANFDSDTALITFSLISQNEMENEPDKELMFELELRFRRGVFKPNLNLVLQNDFDIGKQYVNADKVKCGVFEIELKSSIGYASAIRQLDAKCYLKDINYSEIISFGETNEIGEAAPWTDDTNITTEPTFTSKLMKQIEGGVLRLANITPNNKIKVPVYIDLSKYPVPREKRTENLIININYAENGNTFSEVLEKELVLIPNTTETDLLWELNDGGGDFPLEESFDIDQPISWTKNEDGSMECFSLKLGNMASEADNGGKVVINNFKIEFVYNDDKDYSTIKTKRGSQQYYLNSDLTIFKINGEEASQLPTHFEFKDGHQPKNFVVEFKNKDIVDIPDGIAKINALISYDYKIIDKNNEEKEGHVSSRIKFRLFNYTGDHWVALDFGTAATVAAFADSEAIEMKNIDDLVLDLQNSLQKNLDKSYEKTNIKESDTKFLSSEILLRPATDNVYQQANLNGDDFKTNLVELSPLKNRITMLQSVLPYLKSLIGSEIVPNLNGFKYRKEKDSKPVKNEEYPLRLNDILSNTYQSLISDFVLKSIPRKEKEKANKVIFTIPNIFTPKHTRLIKKVVEEKTDQFNKHYISFVSESDAVLSYYLKSWSVLNKNRADIDKYKSGENDEYIFIYDMGAGTLDITYAKINRDNDGQTTVDIIGRFGSTSAGNYFDAVIAKAIEKLAPEGFFPSIDLLHTDTMLAEERNIMVDLKEAIKKVIKPLLNDPQAVVQATKDDQNKITYSTSSTALINAEDQDVFEIRISDLLSSDEIKGFIEKNSQLLLNEFFGLYSDPERTGEHLHKNQFNINTILFTGRSIQFNKLREAVEIELMEWGNQGDNIHTIYNPDSTELKNIVVKGALQYATSYRDKTGNSTRINNRNVQARYGILTKDNLGYWRFDEFLNPSTTPSSPNVYYKDGITVYKYDTDVHSAHTGNNKIDMSHSSVAFFVQSYSSDTARDVTENKWEYITKMFPINRSVIKVNDYKNIPVRIRIDEENNMVVKVGPKTFGEKEPLSINTVNNNTFKMSMWPYM